MSAYMPRRQAGISIHTFLAEGDCFFAVAAFLLSYFNPHLPRRRRLLVIWYCLALFIFQSTPSSQKATKYGAEGIYREKFQSTPSSQKATHYFLSLYLLGVFQSTPSSQKATREKRSARWQKNYFNPHLPRRRRHGIRKSGTPRVSISIHTFLAEGDNEHGIEIIILCISIHTFLAEGDLPHRPPGHRLPNFNPHLPRRRRRNGFDTNKDSVIFQSTPSSQKAT